MKHKGTKIIETERIILRPFRADDAEIMYHNWASDPEVTKFLTWPTHSSVDVTRQVIESWCDGYSQPENYQWAIEVKGAGELIGSLGAVKIDNDIKSATIGYCISKKWWGQGMVPEALKAVIVFFFEEVGMNCVNACHDPNNPKSGRVMQKCGMKYEGTWRMGGRNNQGICDEAWYSILKYEYDGRKNSTDVDI